MEAAMSFQLVDNRDIGSPDAAVRSSPRRIPEWHRLLLLETHSKRMAARQARLETPAFRQSEA